MSRDTQLFLKDMLAAAQRIEVFTRGVSREQLEQDDMRLHAVFHNRFIIGEAAKNIPQQVREQAAGIDWRGIAGLRDIIAHRYFGLSMDIIWDVLENKLATLRAQLEALLEAGD
jgi:uncharacterized protein with HEPN domain